MTDQESGTTALDDTQRRGSRRTIRSKSGAISTLQAQPPADRGDRRFFTAAVFVISLLLPKTYQATSKLVLNPSAQPLASSDPQSTQRDLATVRVLLTTRELLAAAAKNGLCGKDRRLAARQGDREGRPGRERHQHRRHRRHGPRRGCDRERRRGYVPGPRAAPAAAAGETHARLLKKEIADLQAVAARR